MKNRHNQYITYFFVFLIVGFIWFIWRDIIVDKHTTDETNAGTYGDSFGVVNSFFSAMAFAGVILTIYLQSKELAETREEFKQQNATLIHQRFENTFFQLLNVHSNNVYNLDITHIVDKVGETDQSEGISFEKPRKLEKETVFGKDCFKLMYDRLRRKYWHFQKIAFDKKEISTNSEEEYLFEISRVILPIETLIRSYDRFYNSNEAELGHYFRTMYRIVKFVDQASHFEDNEQGSVLEQKKFYSGLLRAQLSTYEEFLIAYNSLGKHGEKFRRLINKYDLLKGLNVKKMYAGSVIRDEIINRKIDSDPETISTTTATMSK